MHLNIHSLKNKVHGLEGFLDKERPDIECLTEHHVGDQERKTIHFENFNEGSIYCTARKSKGGTAIYLNKGITSREINVSDLAFEGDIELCVVKCDEVKVACVYRPPSGNYKVFFSNFEKLLERICRADATVFVCGDFNINLREEKDKQVKRYGERLTRLLRLNNLNIAIDTPTRVKRVQQHKLIIFLPAKTRTFSVHVIRTQVFQITFRSLYTHGFNKKEIAQSKEG